jgi:hypothetical protein
MVNTRAQFSVESYGIYKGWQDNGKTLPKIQSCTLLVPATVDTEFGLIICAQKAKGETIDWTIAHPDIPDKKGRTTPRIMPPFTGTQYIRNNNWQFYLGDSIWLPEADKIGEWHMFIEHNNKVVAEKTFEVSEDCAELAAERRFWKKRGF